MSPVLARKNLHLLKQNAQWLGELRRQWSAPIRNTLKTKANDYFQSLHFCTWAQLKASHIEQDSWQRLPVARRGSIPGWLF
eukprot:s2391_g2.t1